MGAAAFRITVLGSGTSSGVPTLGCECAVCRSEDPRDQRLRPSIALRLGGRNVLIDTTPDFRAQALRARIRSVDAVLYTHSHADHILGLDDVRPFNYKQGGAIPIYGAEDTLEDIRRVFRYAFDDGAKESAVPQIETHVFTEAPFDVFGLKVKPVPIDHGRSRVYGFRFGRAAYLTDHSAIPEESLKLLEDLDVLFLDALRHRPHPTHSTVAQSLETVERLKPRRAYFTHISHDLGHRVTEETLPPHVRLAYDGLEIDVPA
jgi:phosphoribosyl 1,2-cyclic phosphate phosphodiesterase